MHVSDLVWRCVRAAEKRLQEGAHTENRACVWTASGLSCTSDKLPRPGEHVGRWTTNSIVLIVCRWLHSGAAVSITFELLDRLLSNGCAACRVQVNMNDGSWASSRVPTQA